MLAHTRYRAARNIVRVGKTAVGEAVSNTPSTSKGSGGMVLLGAAGIGLIILAAR